MSVKWERLGFVALGAGLATLGLSGIPGAAPTPRDRSDVAARESSSSNAAPPAPTVESRAIVVKPIVPGEEPILVVPSVEEFFEDHLEIDLEPAKIELGRVLFHDPRLSSDDSISCASCHDLRFGGIDRASVAIGINRQFGPINTPTVYNAAFNVMQFWDGRAPDLEAQADGPPNAAKEMNSNWQSITAKLLKDDRIVELLKSAYHFDEIPSVVDSKYWLEAIADFERTLITPGAPFDAYLSGSGEAISQEAKEGYQLFKDVGCVECHNGIAVGAKSFQKLGRKNPYFGSHATDVDLGRFNVTKREEDKHVFKVPTLRNVALTGPWFHDGSQVRLVDAVKSMGEFQLGKKLTDFEANRIVSFLESLTGKVGDHELAPKSQR